MAGSNLDSQLVKKAHSTQRWTEQDIEHLSKCMDPVNGPHYFLDHFFHIQHPTKGKLVYQAFEYQRRLIDSYHGHRFNVNMLPRQTGKTTTAAGYLLWYAMFIPDSTILIAAHKYTGAKEIMQRIRYAYELCPNFIRPGVTSYNKESIEFDNGSRIVAQTTTETTGRGMSLSLLYADEFAFVPPNVASEFWTSISPTLATGGKAIITSTPNSDEDQFALIWHEANKRTDEFGNTSDIGKNGFFPFKAHWTEHPDRDEKWKNEEMSRIGEERFRREHECEFLIFDETLISSITLAGMEGKEPSLRMGQVRWYKKIDPRSTYVVAHDPSLGTGGDPAAIEIFEVPSMIQVGEWHHNLTPIQPQVKILRDICRYIDNECLNAGQQSSIYYSVENNTLGEAAIIAINEMGEESIPGMFVSEPVRRGHVRKFRRGFNTTNNSKIAACAKLKQMIENNLITINSKSLISELKSFIAKGTSFEAKETQHDDLVAALLLIIRMVVMLGDWDPVVYSKMTENRQLEESDLPMPIYISNSI
jgi:hypothetical protein